MNFKALLSHQAKTSPQTVALAEPGSPGLTYYRLNEFTETVAQSLTSLGARPGDRVAVVLPDGPELAAAFLSIGCCATVAPLNPSYKRPEFEFFLGDLKPALLVTLAKHDSPAVAVAEEANIPVAYLEPSGEPGMFELKGEHRASGDFEWAGDGDAALVLHTSGTTARPKIVPLTHANLLSSAANIAATLQLGKKDSCLNVMPLFHIHGLVGVLLATIRSGGTVTLTSGFSSERFPGWLREVSPTWYSAVPTMHQAILALLESEDVDVLDGVPLRFVRSSSASLPPSLITRLEKKLGVPVVEAYGMTEASHQIASNPLPPAVRKPGSVGCAPAGCVRIGTGETASAAATGAVGEVMIKGDGVTAGYANNETANSAAFVDGWFRTGDLGYLDADGYLYLTGRIKEIINRGGENVSPREVDDVLSEHPAIRQVVTFAVPHATLGEDIAAAVVLHDSAVFDERSIRQFAFERMAGFKIPSHIIALDEIPKGPTGKLQRIGMAEKLSQQLQPNFESPSSDTECSLRDIWEEVLQRNGIGLNDNFFLLGGDSIMATMVVVRVRERIGAEIPIPLVFMEPTLRAQAEAILNIKIEGVPSTELEKYLAELEALTDEEAEAMLRNDASGPM